MSPFLLIAAVALASPAVAEEPPVVGTSTYLDVRLNGQPKGEAFTRLVGDDVWVPTETLHTVGVQSFEGNRARIDGRDWVSLRSLEPQLRFTVDERALALDITVGPALLPVDRIDIGYARPAGTIMGDATTGFANYAVQVDLQKRVSGFGEVGVSSGPALLSSGISVTPVGAPVRGITSFTYEFLSRLEKLVVGDAVVSAGGIGTSAVVGGITYGRDFKLDPYLIVAPRPAFTAFAPTPSTLEVWVNGAMVRQQPVPAGTLDLSNIPVVSGAGDVRTVVRDAFGREQVFDLHSNFAPALLAPGLTDFSYTLGFVRNGLDAASFDYSRPVALGRYRIGLDDVVTVGGRVEASLDRIMAGPSMTWGTLIGQWDLEVVGSMAQGAPGAAAALAWSWGGRRWSGGMRVGGSTPAFSTAALDPWMDRAAASGTAFVSVTPVERLTLGMDLSASRWRDAGDSASATIRASLAVGGGFTVLASATQAVGGFSPGPSGMLSLSIALGDRTTAQASAGAGTQGANGMAGVARSLPTGPGYGYRVEGETGPALSGGSGLFQYQTSFGRYEAEAGQMGSVTVGAVRAAGGIVVAGDRIFATRPVEEAYALVRVGVPGVTAYLENQEVGVTDGAGDLLVPSLLARYSNRLSIRAADIPMDYEVGKVEQIVAPMRRGGMVVHFDVSPVRAVLGRLWLDGDPEHAPGGGEIVLVQDGAELRGATTSDGRFFLEGARPGRHEAKVTWRGGTCRAMLVIGAKAGVQDIGETSCDTGQQLAAAR